jgi:hypothetical protein
MCGLSHTQVSDAGVARAVQECCASQQNLCCCQHMQRLYSYQLTMSVMPKDQMSADVVYLQCRQQCKELTNNSQCVKAAQVGGSMSSIY